MFRIREFPFLQSSSLVSGSAIGAFIVLIFLCSSQIVIIMSGIVQPSYQEEQREQAYTKQYFLVSALMGQSQPPSASIVSAGVNNVSTYQNSSLRLSLQYPSDWKVEERTNINNNNDTASSIKFTSPSKKDLMVVSVYTQNLSSSPIDQRQNITLDNLTRSGITAAKQNLNNLQFLDLETANVTLGLGQNNPAHKVIYSNTNKNATFPLQFVTMQTYTINDGKIYGISYVSEASQFFRHLPAVQRMIDSFHIID
jgi:hypothetical protein